MKKLNIIPLCLLAVTSCAFGQGGSKTQTMTVATTTKTTNNDTLNIVKKTATTQEPKYSLTPEEKKFWDEVRAESHPNDTAKLESAKTTRNLLLGSAIAAGTLALGLKLYSFLGSKDNNSIYPKGHSYHSNTCFCALCSD